MIGPGRTGKSLLANVVREALGEFGLQANMDSFLLSSTTMRFPRISRACGELASSWRPRRTSTGRSTKRRSRP